MPDFNTVAAKYIEIWNEADAAARKRLIAEACTADVTYTDPMAASTTADELNALVDAVHGQFPGMRFGLLGDVDGHHDQARFRWTLGPDGSDALVVGFDVVQLDADGRISNVLGFLDQVPSA